MKPINRTGRSRAWTPLAAVFFPVVSFVCGQATESTAASGWQSPPPEIKEILDAPALAQFWLSPPGHHLLLANPVLYPPLAELAAPMHTLAGLRVNPVAGTIHGQRGAISPRLLSVEHGTQTQLPLPADAEIYGVAWTTDGRKFALTVRHPDHVGLWVGSITGDLQKMNGIKVNQLLGAGADWLPDQRRLLVRTYPDRGPPPPPPPIPASPEIQEGEGAQARSTYEARNLLETTHDDALFDYFATSRLAVVDPDAGSVTPLGEPAAFATAEFSPDGSYLFIERLVPPWSHAVRWQRFAREAEVWDAAGKRLATIASLPTADQVPVQGVPTGRREISWRASAPHSLFWVEALDGGNPVVSADHRDRLMRLEAPFTGTPVEVFRAEHRIVSWNHGWGAEGGMLMLTQRERQRRWLYTWLLDVDRGVARSWVDRNEDDRYGAIGLPVLRRLPNGYSVLRQKGNAIFFTGPGASDEGDRPFLDLRDIESGNVERQFRSARDRHEVFVDFFRDENRLIIASESPKEVPNIHLVTLGESVAAAEGESSRAFSRQAVTHFEDPTPQLRHIQKRLVRYTRDDGVPLSFQLYLPPGHQEGTRLPTIVYAYPVEYSDASTAGQVSGSTQRFIRIGGPSHLFFALQGYAVLHETAMPMIGDPETTYDTFVPQLIADAKAAVAKAVEIGVADPRRIGIIGHSHGALMVANLLAHTDLFCAGIARSGSHNKTMQPFGFQSERRSLFEARESYIQLSPTFFADKVNEPVLIIHGKADANPGTRPIQSEVFYEAVRGSGGTARLVLLPFEDHGYRARESVHHVLWEQLRWFDKYVKHAAQSP